LHSPDGEKRVGAGAANSLVPLAMRRVIPNQIKIDKYIW